MIRDSLVIARIQEWVEDPQYGGFATIEVIMPDNVQPGTSTPAAARRWQTAAASSSRCPGEPRNWDDRIKIRCD
jgi:hypothetical protein